MDIIAHQAVIASYDVGADLLVGMTLVGISRGVVDRCGEEVLGQLVAARRIWLVIAATSATAAPSARRSSQPRGQHDVISNGPNSCGGGEPGQQYRHNDLLDPLWNLLDVTPEGRGDFNPKLSYP